MRSTRTSFRTRRRPTVPAASASSSATSIPSRLSDARRGEDGIRVRPRHEKHLHEHATSEGSNRVWMGDSRGSWQGDTLVVDAVHFSGDTWFDRAGNYHSPEMRVIERYTLLDPDHLQYEATIEDPKVFSRPPGPASHRR